MDWLRPAKESVDMRSRGDDEGSRREWVGLLDEGIRRLDAGEFCAAEECLARVTELKHDCAEAHRALARVYRSRGQLEDAVDALELASHFSPSNAATQVELCAALRRLGRIDAAEVACQRAGELAPSLPEVAVERAGLAATRGDVEGAIAAYHEALRLQPDFVPALSNLGILFRALGRFDEAQEALERAIEKGPRVSEVHHNLGLVLLEKGRFEDALTRFERALELCPGVIETQSCMAHCLRDLGRHEQAIAQYDAVLAEKPDFGDAVINRCYAYLQREDYDIGWAEYERRFEATQTAARAFPYPRWRGEPLIGRTILVYAEQGLGDEVMFASCLPDLLSQGGRCLVECSTQLEGLFRRSFPPAILHAGLKSDSTDWTASLEPIDFQSPIGSLPRFLRPTRSSFPAVGGYLRADPARVEYWGSRLAGTSSGLNIGISWQGGTSGTRALLRSIPLRELAAAVTLDGISLISVQHGAAASDVAAPSMKQAGSVLELLMGTKDIDEHAALISSLDLIISVDNTVVHLAGALGKPVWVLVSASPEWRYPRSGSTMAWYPTARLFHQQRAGIWEGVLEELRAALLTFRKAAGAA